MTKKNLDFAWHVWRPNRGKQLAIGITAEDAAKSVLPGYTGTVFAQSLESIETLAPSKGMGVSRVYLESPWRKDP